MTNKSLLIAFIFLFSLNMVKAEIIIVEPEPEMMNDVEGQIIVCPPTEGLEERSIKLADDFFKQYNFDDDLKEFVQEFIDDFESYKDLDCDPTKFTADQLKDKGCIERSFDEILTDPRFDSFAKIVKLYPDFETKGIFSNLSDMAKEFSASEKIPKCVFDKNKKLISGGLRIEVEGKKTTNSKEDSSYVLTQKNANKSSFMVPVSPLYKISSYVYQKQYESFFNDNAISQIRVLQNPLLSISLSAGSIAKNNFLQKKITDGKSITTRLPSHGSGGLNIKFNTSMYCSKSLYLTGFCNIDSPKYGDRFKYTYNTLNELYDDIDYSDKKYLNNHELSFPFNKITLTKSNINGESKASISASGKMFQKGYEGAKVFVNLNFTKGQDLPDPNIVDFQEKGVYSEGKLVEVNEEEKIPYLDIVVTPWLTVQNSESAKTLGQFPIISWGSDITTFGSFNYPSDYLKYSIQNFDLYRNKEKIARLDADTTSYTDTSLTEADKGKVFMYTVIVNNYFNTIKSNDGSLKLSSGNIPNNNDKVKFDGSGVENVQETLKPVVYKYLGQTMMAYFTSNGSMTNGIPNYYLWLGFTLNDINSNQATPYVPEKIIVLFNDKVYKEYTIGQFQASELADGTKNTFLLVTSDYIDAESFKTQFLANADLLSVDLSFKVVVQSKEILPSDTLPIAVPF